MKRKDMNKKLGLTEEQLDALGEEYESDTWDASTLGKVVMGRPKELEEETKTVTVRLPLSQLVELDRMSAKEGTSRSSTIRKALASWIKNAAAL